MRPAYRRAFAALSALLLAACAGGTTRSSRIAAASAPTTTSTTTPPSTTTSSTSTTSTTTTTIAATGFSTTHATVTAAELGGSWHAGCPVGPADLVAIGMPFWGFDGQVHQGTLVVNTSVANGVVAVFAKLYEAHFPIREMVPQSAYGGDDNAAAAADDTSGFNCRYAVAPGPPSWSVHAYGEAIDVNDVENPYVDASTIIPPAGSAYLDRSDVRPGMAEWGGTLVDAFAAIGWQWGGRWTSGTDYQHFSANGR